MGVTKSWKEAVLWYRKAAEQELPRAQYNLAWCYENGRGVEKDRDRALELYRKAAEQDYADAQKALARLSCSGREKKSGFFKGFFGGRKG